ncbi:metal ABC transporter solute-binding protein, Zn/Mn family [Leifsonia shinshuensis]|uniref:Zinc/manganese transport system substrate-binding protein n=1 Tax=Leifsonia shinshuensis TaxID=150026 RepID=A0A853CNQ4_9MICO|nr:zinc ABC transporter substrate-binding protein [Leifsonia shinshuensis]NYJ22082.1 zinc/manganese transport system substrate-binding protein [Leifsonia shinshuensis]
MQKRSVFALALAAATVAALTGCSAGSSADDGKVRVVASTNVYGDIASTIAGNAVEVTSLMSDPAQDPHSFEASAQSQLAVSKADILIENGGGYDDFMNTLRTGSKNTKATVLNVVDISGKKAVGGELNEHVWYDFPTIEKFTTTLTDALSKADPAQKATFTKNAAAFSGKLAALQNREAELKAKYAGAGIAVTEPVPLYLLEAAGLVNKTPEKFSAAIEAGTDVSPLVLQETLALFSGHQVKLLAYNEQTSGPETERVKAAATAAGIPVVPVTETLPAGKDYVGWMNANLDAVASALAK